MIRAEETCACEWSRCQAILNITLKAFSVREYRLYAMASKILGIDFGSVNSFAAIVDSESGQPSLVRNSDGDYSTPSFVDVSVEPPVVGLSAKMKLTRGFPDVAAFFKPKLGDPNFVFTNQNGAQWTAPQLTALVFAVMKRDAQEALGSAVELAVIAIPPNATSQYQEGIVEAARLAGLEAVDLIPEPVAAVCAHGFHNDNDDRNILVYDWGASSFAVSVIQCGSGNARLVGSAGDQLIGGIDIDNEIVDRVLKDLGSQESEPSSGDSPREIVLAEVERAKLSMSSSISATITLMQKGQFHRVEFSRILLEQLLGDFITRTDELCQQVLADAGIGWDDLHHVILLGGTTRLPRIRSQIEAKVDPTRIVTGLFEDAIALGAVTRGWSLVSDPSWKVASVGVESHFHEESKRPVPQNRVVDSIVIERDGSSSHIELYVGDLAALSPKDAVDVLVVSAFPDEYAPLPHSLIGALYQRGVSVAELAKNKAVDLRGAFSCWMSHPIDSARVNFRRVLCFEPYARGRPGELVGDIFRSLAPFVGSDPLVRTVATPLVGTGYQGSDPLAMLQLLVDAAAHWMSVGMPITSFKIGIHPERDSESLRSAFDDLKTKYSTLATPQQDQYRYDVFVSYSHVNLAEANWFETELRKKRPEIRLFIDRKELNTGVSWQQEIFEALDDCRKVVALLSPTYLASKVCLEEFNIGLFRHRETEGGVLCPIYLFSADLPTYMKLLQFLDCREFDPMSSSRAIDELLAECT